MGQPALTALPRIARPALPEPLEGTSTGALGILGGRYRLEGLLGRGGMADVFAAIDESLGRRVAVKVFRPGSGVARERQRFRSEIELLASLDHPHLVRLFDAGTDEQQPWCVMQLVDGRTLARPPNPLTSRRLLGIGADIASALAHVHQRNIVHRDIKPSNVLLGRDGEAYLCDFGVARTIETTESTRTDPLVGTGAYLSPEQVRGGPVTTASDVFALGLVLLEGITGRREYPGGPIEAAVARLYRSPRIPSTLDPPLAALLAAMTTTEPADRPTAIAVAHRLSTLCAQVTTAPDEHIAPARRTTKLRIAAMFAFATGAGRAVGPGPGRSSTSFSSPHRTSTTSAAVPAAPGAPPADVARATVGPVAVSQPSPGTDTPAATRTQSPAGERRNSVRVHSLHGDRHRRGRSSTSTPGPIAAGPGGPTLLDQSATGPVSATRPWSTWARSV